MPMKSHHVILLILGSCFAGIGLVVGIIFAVIAFSIHDLTFAVTLLIPILLFLIGCGMIGSVVMQIAKLRTIKKNGNRYAAKIYAYVQDYSITVNGRPQINLRVRYYTDQVKEAVIPTGFANGCQKYPIGYTIDIFEYQGNFSWDAASLRNEPLPHEEELMSDRPVEPEKLELIAATCKSCGATYQAAAGYSNRCPYCGNYSNV